MRDARRSEVPRGVTVKGELSMEMIWAQAALSFETICGESLKKGEVKSFEDVRKKIESKCETASRYEPEPTDKWNAAKTVGLQSLQYLKLLVVVASQASSVIPIPAAAASISSTALSFVFDIPEKIKGYDDAIDNVFSHVASALLQFQIYRSMENLDSQLLRQIHMVLASFVKLCAHVVKFRQGGKRERLSERLKVVFAMNTDLDDELSEFKDLLQGQKDVEGTVTLKEVMETKKDLEHLSMTVVTFGKITEEILQVTQETQKGVRSLNDDSERTKELAKIRETLSIAPTVHLDTTTTQTCTDLASKCSEDTGSWIWENDAYKSWRDLKGKDILVVSGSPSSGKTSVCALITKRLEEQKNRTYVGHYFFPASTKKSDDNKNSVQSCLKYIAFQIARVDTVVRKALAKVCDTNPAVFRPPGSSDLNALWKELKIGMAGSTATYCVIIDGIENLPDKQSESLLRFIFDLQLVKDTVGRVRILISGTDSLFDKHRTTAGTAWIQMENNNQDDMRIVIQETLNKQRLLQNPKPNSDQEKAKNSILEKIPQKVNGSYSLLRIELERVVRQLSKRTGLEDLDRMLKQSTSSHETAIQDLERSLTADEISELNELLKWVLWGGEYFTLAQLEAVMVLFSKGTISLISLEYVVGTKYSAVLKLEGNYVYLQDGVEEYLQKSETKTGRSQRPEDGSSISMTISINNVGRELCGHFLWDLADMAIRKQYEFFDSDTLSKMHHSSMRTIAVGELESNYTIVTRAFSFLNDEPKTETQEIGYYLVYWLPEHLRRLRMLEEEDKDSLRDDEKVKIGKNLYTLFKDDVVFKRHRKTFQQTLWSLEEIKEIQLWLMDAAVLRKVESKWRNSIRRARNPIRGYLRNLVKVVVHGLLRDRDWDVTNARYWLERFISVDGNKIQQPLDTDIDEEEGSIEYIEDIDWDHASDWCRELIGLSEADLDSLWYERLAEASSSQGQDPALTRRFYRQAIEKPNPSWRCYRGQGQTSRSQGDIKDAMEQFELALAQARRDDASPKPKSEDIIEIHLSIAQCAYDDGDMDRALKHFQPVCDSEDMGQATQGQLGRMKANFRLVDSRRIVKVLRDTLDGGDKQRVIDLIKAMSLDDEGISLIMIMLRIAKSDSELLRRIVQAMEVTAGSLASHINKGIESPATDEQFTEVQAQGVLLFTQGLAAYKFGVSLHASDPIEEALRLWGECRDRLKKVGGSKAYNTRRNATSALAKHFFQDMLENGLQTDQIEKLNDMRKDDSDQEFNDCVGFLATLYAKNSDKKKAREILGPQIKQALQILSDDFPGNDVLGFNILYRKLAPYGDFQNSAIALSLRGTPDMVTTALSFNAQDLAQNLPDVKEDDRPRVLELITTIAEDIVKATIDKVPDSSQQKRRVSIATAHIESLSAAVKHEERFQSSDNNPGTIDHDSERPPSEIDIAHGVIRDRLSRCDLDDSYSIDRWVTCDGSNPDGTTCGKSLLETGLYHCVYCSDVDFCRTCLSLLRDSEPDLTYVCNPKHQWLLVPPAGDNIYAGQEAESVRRPNVGTEGDDQVLVVSYTSDQCEVVSVAAWKEELAKEWEVSLEELKGVDIEEESMPESDDEMSGEV